MYYTHFLYSKQVNTGQMNVRDGRFGPRGRDFKVQPETFRIPLREAVPSQTSDMGEKTLSVLALRVMVVISFAQIRVMEVT